MELQLFIKETLVQIANGLIEAQNELKEMDFYINPLSFGAENASSVNKQNTARKIQNIKFKVQVDVIETESTQKGLGAKINIFKASIDSDEKSTSQSSTELEFEIPVSFPHSQIPPIKGFADY